MEYGGTQEQDRDDEESDVGSSRRTAARQLLALLPLLFRLPRTFSGATVEIQVFWMPELISTFAI